MSGNGVVKCRFCDFVTPRFYTLKDGTKHHYQARMTNHVTTGHPREHKRIVRWAEAASTVPPPGRAT